MDVVGWMKRGLAETRCTVWRPFAAEFEAAETMEGVT
jgi:hypothetical protein